MNTATNIGLQVLATSAVADGIAQLKSNLTLGLVLVGVGIVLYAIYEYFPTKS